MFAVRGGPSVITLLAILAAASLAAGINYEDLEPSATSHSNHYEEGGGGDRHSGHEDKHGEHVDKGYKSYHEAEKLNKGHHDVDKDHGHYAEDGGENKHHNHDDGYYDEHHKGVEGGSGEKFYEKGHYGKGYSTHGRHEVKKLDEFEKHKEFHDEDYNSDFDEQDGGYHYDHERAKGGHSKGGHHDHAEHEGDYGKKGYYAKGHHQNDQKGYKGNDEHEDYYRNDYRRGKSAAVDDGKKWGYKSGH